MSQLPGNHPIRHRWIVGLTALALLLSALGATAAGAEINYQPAGSPITPITDPSQLQPPQVNVLKEGRHLADGSIFVAPKTAPGGTVSGQQGPEIVDNEGRPIWFQPIAAPYSATDFRVQQYRGQPVLTYGVGQSTGGPGHSEGWDVILDRHYHQVATVQAGNGLAADQHEFALTPQGTALITIYHQVPYDLSSVGGPADGSVLDGVVQEIDVATGKVLFEWHSLDHVPLGDSYQPVPTSASRIIDVRLDQKAHTATLVGAVQHPDGLSAGSQGNAQRLPGGHLFVGSAASPSSTERATCSGTASCRRAMTPTAPIARPG